MLEQKVVAYCAPTLAGLKMANLFNYQYASRDKLFEEVEEQNRKLNIKGVYMEIMKIGKAHALLYVYRPKRLGESIQCKEASQLLCQFGYKEMTVQSCLKNLRQRLAESEGFPHEIGVFLGYPLEDVIGFIEHQGRNCICCGYWKVYCNADEAQQLFCKYRKCMEVYRQVFAKGRSVTQLTVAA